MCMKLIVLCMTCLNHNSDMTYSYVWHETSCVCHASFIFVAWPLFVSWATPGCSRAAEIRVTWLIPMCDMNWFTCETWLMHCVCGMPYSDVWHGAIICVTCLIHVCGMLWSYVWLDSFRSVTLLIHQCGMQLTLAPVRLMGKISCQSMFLLARSWQDPTK